MGKSLIDRYDLDDFSCTPAEDSSSLFFTSCSTSTTDLSSSANSTISDDNDCSEELDDRDHLDRANRRISALDISNNYGKNKRSVKYANPNQIQVDHLLPSFNFKEYVKTDI